MTSKMVLCAAVLAVVFGQACSKKHREVTGPQDEGTLSGDSTTTVKSADGKFLCDFQWTDGLKEWNYKNASGDNPVGNNTAKQPWCLIPYGDSTGFIFSAKSDEGVESYICRDLNASYSLKNEQVFDMDEEYETHQQMMCVPIDSVFVTAKNPGGDYKDEERLYHIRKTNEVYTIDGHLNLRLVKPVHLSVLLEPVWNAGAINGLMAAKLDVPKMKEDWKKYMLKIGYYIDIKTVPVVFPNLLEKTSGNVDDGALTLPQEKDILEFPDKMVSWYNESAKVINGIGDFFGVDIDLPKLKQTEYTIAVTPGYKMKFDVQFKGFDNSTGINICIVEFTVPQSLEIISNIKDMPTMENLVKGEFYDRNGVLLGTGGGLGESRVYGTADKNACQRITQARYDNLNKKADAFSIKNGYVLSHSDFFKSKNAGRLLAALLYSKILGKKYPIDNGNGLFLSTYYDDNNVEQPSEDWVKGKYRDTDSKQGMLLEIASIMQNFERREK